MAARVVQGSSRNQVSASRRLDQGRDAYFLWVRGSRGPLSAGGFLSQGQATDHRA